MSYAPIYRSRRRRRDWTPVIAVSVLILGLSALLLVATAPGKPAAAIPEPAPGVGDLLHAGQDSAIVRGVLAVHGGDILAAVRHLRGQHGTTVYRVTGCPDGGELIDVSTGAARAWERGEAHIFSLIARAACGGPGNTPLEQS